MQRKIEIDSKGEGEKKLNEVCNLRSIRNRERIEEKTKIKIDSKIDKIFQILLQSSSKIEMEKSKGEKETNCILHRIDSRSRENRNENREARKRSGILDGEEKRVASGARERWERRQKRRGEGLKGEGTGARGKGRETGAMRLERGGLDVGRPERARTTALGRLSSFFFPSRHRPRGDQRSVQTAPIHKLAYITPLLRSRNERQPIQGSVTRL